MLQPQQPSPQPNAAPSAPQGGAVSMAPTAQAPVAAPSAEVEAEEIPSISPEEIEAHLDSLEDADKAFLAEHLTPEFVRAISLISGPEVGAYLDQFADKDKVLVPVPRQVAEEYLAKEQGAQSAPQGAPSAPVPAPASPAPQAAQQGMMAPR